MSKQCLAAGHAYAALGISIIPVHSALSTKSPKKTTLNSWKPYQSEIASTEKINSFFSNGADIAVVCGVVSQNLEIIDFDELSVIDPFLDTLEQLEPELFNLLIFQKTPSGGRHILFRCEEPALGNQKLARSADGKKVFIETRGQGGYFLVEPSAGYTLERNLSKIKTITGDQRETLHKISKSFDLYRQKKAEPRPPEPVFDERPGDIFNREARWFDLLTAEGWTYLGRNGDRDEWKRPGKEDEGISATVHPEKGLFVFSSNTNLPQEQPLSKFSFLSITRFGGDFSAAAKSLNNDQCHNMSQQVTTSQQVTRMSQTSDTDVTNYGDVSDEVKLFVAESGREFSLNQLYQHIGVNDAKSKASIRKCLQRMKDAGIITQTPGMRGMFEPVVDADDGFNPFEVPHAGLDIKLPLGFGNIAEIHKGDIFLIMGESDAGKSVWMATILAHILTDFVTSRIYKQIKSNIAKTMPKRKEAKENWEHGIRYMCSEAPGELGKKIVKIGDQFGLDKKSWLTETSFQDRTNMFHQAILPNGINFVDYLNVSADPTLAAVQISQMQERLKDGVLFLAMQKLPGRDHAVGGFQVNTVPRTILSLSNLRDGGWKVAKIEKIKHAKSDRDGYAMGSIGQQCFYVVNPRTLEIKPSDTKGWHHKTQLRS